MTPDFVFDGDKKLFVLFAPTIRHNDPEFSAFPDLLSTMPESSSPNTRRRGDLSQDEPATLQLSSDPTADPSSAVKSWGEGEGNPDHSSLGQDKSPLSSSIVIEVTDVQTSALELTSMGGKSHDLSPFCISLHNGTWEWNG